MILGNLINASVFIFLVFDPLKTTVDFIVFIMLLVVSGATGPLLKGGSSMFIQDIFTNQDARIVANALTSISFDMTYICGSMISGLIMALGYGVKVYVLVASLYVFVALCVWRVSRLVEMRKQEHIQKSEVYTSYFSNLKSAFQTIISNPTLLYLMLMNFLWNMFLWAGLTVLLPILVKQHFMAGASQYGLLESMSSIGIVIGSFVVGKLKVTSKWLVLGVVGTIGLHGLLFSLIGFATNVQMTAVLLITIGLVVSPALIYQSTFYQQTFDSTARGALFTISGTMTSASYPIGIALTSSLASTLHSNVTPIFVTYGLIIAVISLIVYFRVKN